MTFSEDGIFCNRYNYVIEEYLMKWKHAYSTTLNEKDKAMKQYVQNDRSRMGINCKWTWGSLSGRMNMF